MLKVKHVSYYEDYKLFVELSDGNAGYFDVFPYTDKRIFTQLKNVEYLKLVKVNFCGICWPAGQDFSADTIAYEMLQLPNKSINRMLPQ